MSANLLPALSPKTKSFLFLGIILVIKNSKILIFSSTFLIIVISIFGILKLEVENSFINYFDKETEIYKGMKIIDDELGGTTPLNIILKFPIKENFELNFFAIELSKFKTYLGYLL